MQVPGWVFLACILVAAVWQDMASLLRKRSFPTAGLGAYIKGSSLPSSVSRLGSVLSQEKAAAQSKSRSSLSITSSHKSFHTTAASMSSTQFLETVKNRRTYYALKKESPISDQRIQEIISETIRHVPSSFNSQSTRAILLVKEEHNKLWDITKEILKAIVPPEQFASTEQRINGFRAGYGTVCLPSSPFCHLLPNTTSSTTLMIILTMYEQVLFFESRAVVSGMQEKFALYADKFPLWAAQSDAMHQFTIWTALEAEGLGANLQHYNPLIDARVAKEWNVDKDWELNAQLVFGTPAGGAGEKSFESVEERFKVYGA
jgi:predicted oxidoreductase (fatty acid repression mutant protein)